MNVLKYKIFPLLHPISYIQYAYFGSIVYWRKTLPFYMERRNKICQKLALSQLINSNWSSTVAIEYNMHEMIWTECEREAFV